MDSPGQGSPAERIPSVRPGLVDRDWQQALIILLTILAGVALVWVTWQVITPFLRTIILFLLAGVLTFALAPPVNWLEKQIGNRIASIAIVYFVFGFLLIGGLILLAGPFVAQATTLATDLPQYVDELRRRTPELEAAVARYGLPLDLPEIERRALTVLNESGGNLLTHLVSTISEVGGLLLDAVLALVISFYLLVDGPKIRARVFRLVPPQHHDKALFFEINASRVLGGYLRGQLIMAVTIGIMAGVGVALLGLPYPIVIGVLAGLFELVPMFGPILAAAPAVLVGTFQGFPTVLWVIIFFIIIQQFESNVLGPRITGHAVGLHPLGAMFALLAGFQVAGVLGGLFAVPLAGIIWVVSAAAYRNVVTEPQRPRRGLVARFRRRPETMPPSPRHVTRPAPPPHQPAAPAAPDEPAE